MRLPASMTQVFVAAAPVTRLGYDAGVVPACRQHEIDLSVEQMRQLENGSPRRDMIRDGTNSKDRSVDGLDIDRLAVNFEPSLGEVVVEIEPAQIFGMHAVGHASRIRVPRHEIGHRRALAHEIFAHDARPYEVLERSIWKAPAMRRWSRKPSLHIRSSSIETWLSSMNRPSSPGSSKSTCAANSESDFSRSSPSRAMADAAIESSVPPRQYPTPCILALRLWRSPRQSPPSRQACDSRQARGHDADGPDCARTRRRP